MSVQVFSLPSTCGHPLASTCIDVGRAQIRRQVDANVLRLATQLKSIQVDRKSAVIINRTNMREIYSFLRLAWTYQPTCESIWPPFTSAYASSGYWSGLALTFESVCVGLAIETAVVRTCAKPQLFSATVSEKEKSEVSYSPILTFYLVLVSPTGTRANNI